MRAGALFLLVLSSVAPAVTFAKCGDRLGDAAAVALARSTVDAACDCAGAASHRDYVRCAAASARAEALAGRLRPECRAAVLRCAARSTCGRPGAVACCRTRRGTTRCALKRSAAQCRAPSGGRACVGAVSSCCDACAAGGCAVTPTTSSTIAPTTTTTTAPAYTCATRQFPQCDGTCPAGEACRFDAAFPEAGCGCFPAGVTPCAVSAFPGCGGACLDGRTCQAVQMEDLGTQTTQRVCLCVDPEVPCGPSPGACASLGVCPPDSICLGFTAGGSAECGCTGPTTTVTTTTVATTSTMPGPVECLESAYPQCGGTCTGGLVCQAIRLTIPGSGTAHYCQCVDPGRSCFPPPPAVCDEPGVCPPGFACTAFIVPPVPECGCAPW